MYACMCYIYAPISYKHASHCNDLYVLLLCMCVCVYVCILCMYVCMHVCMYDTLVEDTSSACLMIFSMACAAMA